jgi:hypothetical protein
MDLLLKALHVELSVEMLCSYVCHKAACRNAYAGRVCALQLVWWMCPNLRPYSHDRSHSPSGYRSRTATIACATTAGSGACTLTLLLRTRLGPRWPRRQQIAEGQTDLSPRSSPGIYIAPPPDPLVLFCRQLLLEIHHLPANSPLGPRFEQGAAYS